MNYKFKNKTKYWPHEDETKKLLHFLKDHEMLHPGVTKANISILEDASLLIEQNYETDDASEAGQINRKTFESILQGKEMAEQMDTDTKKANEDEIRTRLRFDQTG